MENIIFFNKDLKKIDDKVRLKLGIRGRRAVDLAMMGLASLRFHNRFRADQEASADKSQGNTEKLHREPGKGD
jgi:hypothetical protein